MTEKGWEQFILLGQLYTISVSFSFVRVARLSSKVKVKKTKRITNGRRPRKKEEESKSPQKVQIQENGRLRLVVPPLLYYSLKNKMKSWEKNGKIRKKKESKRKTKNSLGMQSATVETGNCLPLFRPYSILKRVRHPT
jgi:hypothetical protein